MEIENEKYEEMVRDLYFLRCLRWAGVDNWNGYDYAIDMYNEKYGGEDD